MKYDLTHALTVLAPTSGWSLTGSSYEGLVWYDDAVPKPSEDEIQSAIAELDAKEPMRLLRIERNKRLAQCDWVVIRAYSQNAPVPEEWSLYMQTLRDLPETAAPALTSSGELDPTSVAWPAMPSSSNFSA